MMLRLRAGNAELSLVFVDFESAFSAMNSTDRSDPLYLEADTLVQVRNTRFARSKNEGHFEEFFLSENERAYNGVINE